MHFSCTVCWRHHDRLSAGCGGQGCLRSANEKESVQNNGQAGEVPQSAQTSRFGAHFAPSYLSSIALGPAYTRSSSLTITSARQNAHVYMGIVRTQAIARAGFRRFRFCSKTSQRRSKPRQLHSNATEMPPQCRVKGIRLSSGSGLRAVETEKVSQWHNFRASSVRQRASFEQRTAECVAQRKANSLACSPHFQRQQVEDVVVRSQI